MFVYTSFPRTARGAHVNAQEDRQAREHAAIRIQAISRGKNARRNDAARQPTQGERRLPATKRREENTAREPRSGAVGQGRPDADSDCLGNGGAVAEGRGQGADASGGSPFAGPLERPKTDKEIAELIASLVDERLTVRMRPTLAGKLYRVSEVYLTVGGKIPMEEAT